MADNGLLFAFLLSQALGLNWNFWTILLLEFIPILIFVIVILFVCEIRL